MKKIIKRKMIASTQITKAKEELMQGMFLLFATYHARLHSEQVKRGIQRKKELQKHV